MLAHINLEGDMVMFLNVDGPTVAQSTENATL